MARITRPIRAFVVHGRLDGNVLDYRDFFDWVGGLVRGDTRVQLTPELVLAIEKMVEVDGIWQFRFVSGNPSEIPLVYDEAAGETFEEERTEGRWRATATRVAVAPEDRMFAIEARRAGVGAVNLERYFSKLAKREGYATRLSLDLNPLPSPSFVDELDTFERIREAVIVVRRPNTDWDDADDMLSDLADDSGGHRAAISVSAARGESLSDRRGIMQLIREHLRRPLSNVNDVKVKGQQADSKAERTLSLTKHQMQRPVDLQSGMSLSVEDETVFQTANALIELGTDVVANLQDLSPSETE